MQVHALSVSACALVELSHVAKLGEHILEVQSTFNDMGVCVPASVNSTDKNLTIQFFVLRKPGELCVNHGTMPYLV